MTFAGWGLILGPLSQLPQVFACLDVRSVMFGVTLLNIVLVGGFTPPIQRKKTMQVKLHHVFPSLPGKHLQSPWFKHHLSIDIQIPGN